MKGLMISLQKFSISTLGNQKKKKGGEGKIVPCEKRQRYREKGEENNPPQLYR